MVPCTKVLSQSTSGFRIFTPSDRSRRARQACYVSFLISQHRKVISLLKMELSALRPIFCVHKGSVTSIVHLFSIEPLCRRQLLLALQIALAQKSYVLTLSQIQSHDVHKGSGAIAPLCTIIYRNH